MFCLIREDGTKGTAESNRLELILICLTIMHFIVYVGMNILSKISYDRTKRMHNDTEWSNRLNKAYDGTFESFSFTMNKEELNNKDQEY